jgi:hypothetical protein
VRDELHAIGESFHTAAPVPEAAPEPGRPAAPTEVHAADSGESDVAVTVDAETQPTPVELPDWVKRADRYFNRLDRDPAVVVSDEWATVAESEAQLEALAAAAIARQLQMQGASTPGWLPSRDFIHQSGALQQRFVEETTLKVGEFESPMYRSYWQVAVTPGVRDKAYSQWKRFAVDQRLAWLGGGTAGITLLFAMIAAMLRFDSATSGRYRRHMFAAVGISTTLLTSLLVLG